MSISKEIERLQQAKKEIGDAIVRKGGSVSGTLDTYAKSVMALGDVNFKTAIDIVNKSDAKNVDLTMLSPRNETNLIKLFFKNGNLVSVNVSNWDTSQVTDFTQAISLTHNLESIDVSNWDTSNVVNFFAMFDESYKIKVIDVSKWNTSSAENMNWMFCRCSSITTLDVSKWNTSNVKNMAHMFMMCSSLTTLDLSGFDTSKVTTMLSMFNGCTSLSTLDLSGFDTTNVTNMNTMFFNNIKLNEVKCDGMKLPNIELDKINFNYAPLTVDSIVGLLNALPQSDKGYSFQIGSDNIAKLSDEQKAIATDKGWTLI